MISNPQGPKNKEDNKQSSTYDSKPETAAGREGGDDILSDPDPHDSRLDEKIVVNTQRENKIVNAPSQTDAHPSEGEYSVDEL